ncbi:MAG: hypothetical protein L7T80_08870 [Arenicellales bacterium]|nr:hypothetical protein [Arenicellales bacterium]
MRRQAAAFGRIGRVHFPHIKIINVFFRKVVNPLSIGGPHGITVLSFEGCQSRLFTCFRITEHDIASDA